MAAPQRRAKEETVNMKTWRAMAEAAVLIVLCAWIATAQDIGQISGTVYDMEGKPWPDVTITLKEQQTGRIITLKTDKRGNYQRIGVKDGVYEITFAKEAVTFQKQTQIGTATDAKGVATTAQRQQIINMNFKEELVKNAEYEAAMKKQAEESQKFENMKVHFDAGMAAFDQANQIQKQIAQLPADQRGPMQEKLPGLFQTAISELQASEKAAGEKNPSLHMVMGNLGQAYEASGRYEEAAAAFQQATELKPTEANYYLGLGTNLAHIGKMQEAGVACDKWAALQPNNAAACWRNIGVVLYNQNKVQDAVEPLRKATQIEPKNADTWYLLGAALLNSMGSKMENGKLVAIIAPGTVEAYQKYLELAPDGPHAADSQAALETLKSLGAGVETKVSTRKKK
jgi:tetratricopeptide (TPR) repeat protein